MAKNTKSNFDAELFGKRMRLTESDMQDASVAFTQARQQAHEHNPPLSLVDCVVKYMSPPRPSMDQVEDDNARLEQENAAIRAENARVKQDMANLIAQRNGDGPMDENHDFYDMVDKVYGAPEGRIIAIMGLVAMRLGVYLEWETTVHPTLFWLINIVFLIPLAMVFCDWVQLQFQRMGVVVLMLRTWAILTGLLYAYSTLFKVMPWELPVPVSHISSNLIEAPQWAFATLAGTTLIACSKAAWFIRRCFIVFVMPLKPVQVLRGMF